MKRRLAIWALNKLAPTQMDYEPGDLSVYTDGAKWCLGVVILFGWRTATGEWL